MPVRNSISWSRYLIVVRLPRDTSIYRLLSQSFRYWTRRYHRFHVWGIFPGCLGRRVSLRSSWASTCYSDSRCYLGDWQYNLLCFPECGHVDRWAVSDDHHSILTTDWLMEFVLVSVPRKSLYTLPRSLLKQSVVELLPCNSGQSRGVRSPSGF